MRLASDGPWYTVVGVVEDVAINGLSGMAELPLQLYQSLEGRADNQTFLIRVETGRDPATLLPLMRELAIEMEPDAVVTRLGTAESFLSDTLAQERFTSLLLAGFAMMALVLSAVGLYGVVTQLVGQRTREIGIRIALGAHPGAIRLMVLTRSAGATVVGIAAGALLAMQGLKALSSTVFGLDKAGAPAYLVAAAALAATALLASWMPARRATRIDPTEAMRSE
jgi:ABC-type lipoprotein release transport system permease subunit